MQDHPLPLGPAETISAPHMHARALELLSEKLVPGARVLDVGSVRSCQKRSSAGHSGNQWVASCSRAGAGS